MSVGAFNFRLWKGYRCIQLIGSLIAANIDGSRLCAATEFTCQSIDRFEQSIQLHFSSYLLLHFCLFFATQCFALVTQCLQAFLEQTCALQLRLSTCRLRFPQCLPYFSLHAVIVSLTHAFYLRVFLREKNIKEEYSLGSHAAFQE